MNSKLQVVNLFGQTGGTCTNGVSETGENPKFAPEKDSQLYHENSDINNNVNELYHLLVTKAPYLPAQEDGPGSMEEIPWVDQSLVEHSIAFHRKHFSQVIVATTVSLTLGFSVKPNSAVILKTGKLHDPEASFQRYLQTMRRIGKFFLLKFDPDRAYKAFEIVRKMHALVGKMQNMSSGPSPQDLIQSDPKMREIAEAVKKDLGHIDTSSAPKHLLTWNPPVPLSQFDMATTQFGFIGMMWLFPRIFGIKNRDEELKGVLHMWAIFGRLLGIRDEFNVCIKPDPQLYDMMFRNIVVESLKTMDEAVVAIQVAFMKAFTKRVPFMTHKAIMFFGLQELEGFTGENLWKLMSWTDKLSLKILQFWFWAMRNSAIYKYISHFFVGLWTLAQKPWVQWVRFDPTKLHRYI